MGMGLAPRLNRARVWTLESMLRCRIKCCVVSVSAGFGGCGGSSGLTRPQGPCRACQGGALVHVSFRWNLLIARRCKSGSYAELASIEKVEELA